MAKLKTHEEFIKEVKCKQPHLLVLDRYINNTIKLRFKCMKHNYVHEANPNQILNNGCPVCSGARKTTDTFKAEAVEKNNKVDVIGEYINSAIKIKCRCKICGEEFYTIPSCVLQGNGHYKCSMIQNGENRRRTHSDFILEIDRIYNGEYSVRGEYKTARKKVKIKHNNCGYEWDVVPDSILHKKTACPKCSNLRRRTHEEYISELNVKQPTIKCLETFYTIETKLNHQCSKCNYIWKVRPESLIRSNKPTGCPMCRGGTNTVVCGVNDIWTTNKEIGQLLLNPNDGYKYSAGSNKKLKWKCPDCNCVSTQLISKVKLRGLSCKFCSDGISYPNKLMANILMNLDVAFEVEKYFKWCKYKYNNKNKRGVFDFYFIHNGSQYAIEMDGYFHYNDNTMNGQTHAVAKDIDNIKDALAEEHGIIVIRINCENSNFNYIKNNILASDLSSMFDLSSLDWISCDRNCSNSKMNQVWNLWNDGNRSTRAIVEKLGLDIGTVIKYLKRGTSIGICDYSKEESMALQKSKIRQINKKKRKAVICITTNEQFVSLAEANRKYKTTSVDYCCEGKRSYAGKHPLTGEELHWQYYNDYIKEKDVMNHTS